MVNILPDMLVIMSLEEFSFVFNTVMLVYALPAFMGSLNVIVTIFVCVVLVLFARVCACYGWWCGVC